MTGPKNSMAGHLGKGGVPPAPSIPEWEGRDGTIETEVLNLGLCECPGRPHAEGDTAEVKKRLAYGDLLVIIAAGETGVLGLGSAHMVVRSVVSWNLQTRDPETRELVPLPVDLPSVMRLSPAQGLVLNHYCQDMDMSVAVPKDADVPSPDTLEASPS